MEESGLVGGPPYGLERDPTCDQVRDLGCGQVYGLPSFCQAHGLPNGPVRVPRSARTHDLGCGLRNLALKSGVNPLKLHGKYGWRHVGENDLARLVDNYSPVENVLARLLR